MRPDIKFVPPLREAQINCAIPDLVNRVNPVRKTQSIIFPTEKSVESESTIDNQQPTGESKVNPCDFEVSFGESKVSPREFQLTSSESNPPPLPRFLGSRLRGENFAKAIFTLLNPEKIRNSFQRNKLMPGMNPELIRNIPELTRNAPEKPGIKPEFARNQPKPVPENQIPAAASSVRRLGALENHGCTLNPIA